MDIQTLTSEFWKVRLPEDWVHKPSIDHPWYWESPDGAAGVYLSTFRINEPVSAAIHSARSSERRNLPGDGEWQVLHESESDAESLVEVVSEYLNREKRYRLVSRMLGRSEILVRLTFHDYDCADPLESAARSSPLVNSLEFLEAAP